MKKITLLLVFTLVSILTNAQQYQNAFQFAGDGTTSFSVKVIDIEHNDELNITYVTGSYQGTVDFQPGIGINMKTSVTEIGYLASYNESGELLWFNDFVPLYASIPIAISYGSEAVYVLSKASSSIARVIAFNKSTGVYIERTAIVTTGGSLDVKDVECRKGTDVLAVVGSFSGTLTSESRTLTSNGDNDAFYLKYFSSSSSNLFFCDRWANYGGTGNDFASAVAFTNASTAGIVICGSFSGTADFDISNPNTITKTSNGALDGFVLYLNNSSHYPALNKIITIGGIGDDIINDIQFNDTKITIGGQFQYTVDFDPSPSSNTTLATGNVSFDPFIARYDFDTTNGIIYSNVRRPLTGSEDQLIYKIKTLSSSSNVHFLAQSTLGGGFANSYGFFDPATSPITIGAIGLTNSGPNFYRSGMDLGGANGEYVYVGGTIIQNSDLNYESPTQNVMTYINNGPNGYLLKMGACNLSADTPNLSSVVTPICVGQSKTLTIDPSFKLNNNNEWRWYQSGSFIPINLGSGSSITVSPNTTTNYFVRGEGGCVVNGANRNFTVTINPLPNANTSVTGNTITSSEVGGVYQWIDCNNGNAPIPGATQQSYSPSASGNFACIVANIFDCQVTTSCVNFTFLNNQEFEKLGIKLYPNPVKDTFSIMGDIAIEKLTVYNLLGQNIKMFTANDSSYDISELASGTYIIEVSTEKGIAKTKIIKE